MLGGLTPRRAKRALNLAGIPNCEFWIDAARFDTITFAGGTDVQRMRDLSGKGRHLTKTGAGNETVYPTYVASEKGVRFLQLAFDQMIAGNTGDWNFLHNGAGCTILMMVKIDSDFAANGTLLSTASEANSGVGTNLFYFNLNQNVNVTTRNGTSQALYYNGANNSLQKDVTQILSVHIEDRPATVPDLVTRNKGISDIIAPSYAAFSTANSTGPLFVGKLASGVFKAKFVMKKIAIFSRRLRPDEEQRILRDWARTENIALNLPTPKCLAVIAGQSNAKGRGTIAGSLYAGGGATIANAFMWNNAGYSWATLQAGVNNDAYDNTRLGVEMSLAKYFTTNKNLPLYIVKYAVDGSSLPQWLPANAVHFPNLQESIQRAVWSIEDSGAPVKPVALVWYQGESDALNAPEAAQYAARLPALIDGVNALASVTQIPFYIVQIQQNPYQAGTATVQQAGLTVSFTAPYSAYTSFVETGDIATNIDTHHVDANTFEALGARIVQRMKF